MSHFSVVVRVPASVSISAIEDEVAKLLLPYKEAGCGSDDPPELAQFLKFNDLEDEYREEYASKGSDMVETPSGERVYPWDERFRIKGSFGLGGDTHRIPSDCKKVEVKHRDRWPTFEAFAKEYHGSKPDKKTGRHGYWQNPNRKWDWYAIGGRWDGKFPVKPGVTVEMGGPSWFNSNADKAERATNVCRIRDLDWDTQAEIARKRVATFLAEWKDMINGKKFDAFEGPRDTALDMGWLECKDADELPDVVFWKQKWPRQNRPGIDRFDVVPVEPNEAEWMPRLLAHFNPIRPYAFMDASGWRARGRMGWFGCSDDTPESNDQANRDFFAWVRSGDQSDWLVCVDCHI